MQNLNKPFVIPQSPKSLLAKIVNGEIIIEKTIDIPYNSVSGITENNLIVALCHEPNELRFFDKAGKLIVKKTKGVNFKALAIKKNVVYLGGEFTKDSYGGSMFSIVDLNNPVILIDHIDLPVKAVEGKAIDELLIIDNKLILVDDVVFPKYILEYDISVPNIPHHILTKQISDGGTDQTIKADANKDWFVLFTSGSNRSHIYINIEISGKTEGELHFSINRPVEDYPLLWGEQYDALRIALEKTRRQRKPVNIEDKPAYFRDICLVDNYLFILRNNGLGYINLYREIDISKFKRIKTKIRTYDKFIKTENNDVIVVDESHYELINNKKFYLRYI